MTTLEIYDKGFRGIACQLRFSQAVRYEELECKCKSDRCHYTLLHPRLAEKIAIIRKASGSHLIITSAFRCQSHNQIVGGERESFHTKGMAVDLYPEDGEVEDLYHLMSLYFDKVIKYDTFVHGNITTEEIGFEL